MNLRNHLLALAVIALLSLVNGFDSASAEEYVWARTAWGASNINARYGSASNGYGGYWVPKSAAGNNYEAQGNFTNPTGYIIPSNAQPVNYPARPGLFQNRRNRRW